MKKLLLLSLGCGLLLGSAFARPMAVDNVRRALDSPMSRPYLQQNRTAPIYTFTLPPISIMTNYYDYMIGSYNSLPLRVVPDAAGGGYFLTYHGRRLPYTGSVRRTFYAYLSANGALQNNNEIAYMTDNEGYPSMAMDPVSGKPLYAWHANVDTDPELEVRFVSDAFLFGMAGLINEEQTAIDNPLDIMINGQVASANNEFLWPTLQIGPSPFYDKSRAYVAARNFVSHVSGQRPSENVLIAYTDFDANMIEWGIPLVWSYTSIPEMNLWNHDLAAWRRPFHALTTDDLGNVYYAGYHITYDNNDNLISEPNLDMFVCPNYGEGTWSRVADSGITPSWDPAATPGGAGYFNGAVQWDIVNSSHLNAVSSGDGKIIFPALFSLTNITGSYYPVFHTLKAVIYDIAEGEFSISEIYPRKHPEDHYNEVFTPWDRQPPWGEAEYVQGINGEYYLDVEQHFPFPHWDSDLHDGAMMFHYTNLKVSEVNDQGMMVAVWQDSQRARLYNLYPDSYPDLAPYANTPEIYISVSSDRGQNWSDPIVLNKVETPQLNDLKPMWVYPADLVKYQGMQDGNKIGRIGLMFYNDYTWGSHVLTFPAHHTNDGGEVMFTELEIVFPQVFSPTNDPFDNPVVLSTSMTLMAGVLIDGEAASGGDVLAAFVDVNGEPQLRGKQALLIHDGVAGCLMQIYTEVNNEDIYFRIWDASTNEVLSVTESLNSIVNGTIGSWPDNVYWLHALGNSALNINLQSGWNMCSLNVHPPDTSIPSVLSGIHDRVMVVKSPDGIYQPNNPYNSLHSFVDGKGYAVKMSAPATLTVQAPPIAESTPLPLQAGWNLVGYLPHSALDVPLAIASIASHLIQIKGMEGVYEPGNPYNSLVTLSPGRSYWMMLDGAASLIYSAVDRFAAKAAQAQSIPSDLVLKSNSQSIMLGFEPAVPAGDTIMAFVDGELRGITQVREANGMKAALLQIFSDTAGEELQFRLKSSCAAHSIRLGPGIQTAPGSILGDYAQGQYFMLSEDQGDSPLLITSLGQPYPNPFNKTTSIALTVGKDVQNITVEIYNVRGQKVKTLVHSKPGASQMNLIWDALDDAGHKLASGIYFCRLKHAQGSQTVKLMLLK